MTLDPSDLLPSGEQFPLDRSRGSELTVASRRQVISLVSGEFDDIAVMPSGQLDSRYKVENTSDEQSTVLTTRNPLIGMSHEHWSGKQEYAGPDLFTLNLCRAICYTESKVFFPPSDDGPVFLFLFSTCVTCRR